MVKGLHEMPFNFRKWMFKSSNIGMCLPVDLVCKHFLLSLLPIVAFALFLVKVEINMSTVVFPEVVDGKGLHPSLLFYVI